MVDSKGGKKIKLQLTEEKNHTIIPIFSVLTKVDDKFIKSRGDFKENCHISTQQTVKITLKSCFQLKFDESKEALKTWISEYLSLIHI